MNTKKIITAVLLAFVVGSVGYMVARETKSDSNSASVTTETDAKPQTIVSSGAEQSQPNETILVYYFHGDVRCPTCHKLEEYAKDALETYFTDDLAKGRIQWKPTNIDTTGNEHFIKDYSLVTKSVVISARAGDKESRWQNLDKIWDLVGDKDKYLAYIRDSIKEFSAEKKN